MHGATLKIVHPNCLNYKISLWKKESLTASEVATETWTSTMPPLQTLFLLNCILCEKPHTSTWKGIPGTWKAVYPLATSPILGCGTKRGRICTRHNISPTTYVVHGTDSWCRSLHFQSFEFLSSPIMIHCRWRRHSVSSPFQWTFPTAFPVIMLLHARHWRELLLA